MSADPRTGVSAEAFTAVVAAYADRVHDDVRRLGCGAADAVEVVGSSALAVLDRLRTSPHRVEDVVGAWFREARVHADRIVPTDSDEPADPATSGAIVQQSAEQVAAGHALERVPERDRMAVLLRDSYDLPYPSVAVALVVDPAVAPAVVAHARLRFASELAGAPPPDGGHDVELAALALQVDGALPADRERAVAAHLAGCDRCAAAMPALREARRVLRGLAVVAMPDDAREALLERVGAAAARVLPDAAAVAAALAAADADAPPRTPSPAVVACCLALAVVLGTASAVVTTDGRGNDVGAAPEFPALSVSPTRSTSASPSASPSPSPAPVVRSTASARPTGSPSPRPTGSPTRTFRTPPPDAQTLALSPDSGPDCTRVTAIGHNWIPFRTVTITYRDIVGTTPLGPEVRVEANEQGGFRTEFYACDPTHIPGPHVVRATNGSQTREAVFNAR